MQISIDQKESDVALILQECQLALILQECQLALILQDCELASSSRSASSIVVHKVELCAIDRAFGEISFLLYGIVTEGCIC